MSSFQICREEKGEWKLSSETTEALIFFEQEKMNIEKYAALSVLLYEQRKAEELTCSSESNCLCILLI